jgi:hypothetical protein
MITKHVTYVSMSIKSICNSHVIVFSKEVLVQQEM